ncbi:MAG: cytochrome c [Actinobacteria bacterium]|nr:cytochrome c [Actinomycetota bacterium]MDA3017091.1 cytochrome c [Actinomycetota bacterium]
MSNKLSLKFSSLTAVALLMTLGACSSSSSSAPVDLSPEAAAGREISINAGCASCHGADGNGRIGPNWIGLADSQVTLSDGTVVTADDAYLYESIKDPAAKKRRGASGIMPSNKLTDEEIASIIVYIRALK